MPHALLIRDPAPDPARRAGEQAARWFALAAAAGNAESADEAAREGLACTAEFERRDTGAAPSAWEVIYRVGTPDACAWLPVLHQPPGAAAALERCEQLEGMGFKARARPAGTMIADGLPIGWGG